MSGVNSDEMSMLRWNAGVVSRRRQSSTAVRGMVRPMATSFATICATLAAAAAEIDIQAIEDAGELAMLAFSRIAEGQTNKEVAGDLGCTESAVEQHITHILRRASAPNRATLLKRFWSGS